MAAVASTLAETDPLRAHRLTQEALQASRLDANATSDIHPRVLSKIIAALAATDQPSKAESIARTSQPEPFDQMHLLADASEALAPSCPARAARLAKDAENIARGLGGWESAACAMHQYLTEALVIAGRPDLAWRQIAGKEESSTSPQQLAVVGAALAPSQPERSARLVAQAEQAAREGFSQNPNSDVRRAHRAQQLALVAQAIAVHYSCQAEQLIAEAEETVLRLVPSPGTDPFVLEAITDVKRAVRLFAVTKDAHNSQLPLRASRLALAPRSSPGHADDADRSVRRLLAKCLAPHVASEGISWSFLPMVAEVAPDAVVALYEWTLTRSA